MSANTASDPLAKIKHIVVLMMENRSFDQMLGYLQQAGMPEVEGLTGLERNFDDEGNEYKVFEFAEDETAFHAPGKPLDKSLDPGHSPRSVAQQLSEDNGGFVKNFIAEKKPPEQWRRLPMGYYTAKHLPVYDFLARSTASVTLGTARSPATPGPIASTPSPAGPASQSGRQTLGLIA